MIRVGISGWTYAPWRGTFYPAGLVHRRELGYVAERMNSVEINGSFYALQRRSSYETWAAAVPPDFLFSVKGGRFLTHMKKLSGVETALANFFASGLLALGPKLGPVLWQLPATFVFDADRLDAFFAQLPRTAGEAAALAAGHDARVPTDHALTNAADPGQRLQHVLEPRHESFRSPACLDLLRRHGVGMVISDNPGQWPVFEEVTADLVYIRLHGHEQLYASGYSDAELDIWAERINGWAASGLDAYVYCDNDAKVRAPYDAMGLVSRLGIRP